MAAKDAKPVGNATTLDGDDNLEEFEELGGIQTQTVDANLQQWDGEWEVAGWDDVDNGDFCQRLEAELQRYKRDFEKQLQEQRPQQQQAPQK